MEHHESTKLFSGFPPISTDKWEEKIIEDLKGADYDKKLLWKTDEGFNVKPYYRAEDLDGLEYLDALPGESPYIRGLRKESNEWVIRQDFYTSEIEQANLRAREAISRGAKAVGLNATEISTHKQMSRLLAGIDLSSAGINFISSSVYPQTLELFLNEVSNQGCEGEKLQGSINFDPISYLLLHGNFYANWSQNLAEAENLLFAVQAKLPHFKVITINGHYFQNAGSSLVQELAFSLASANEYLAGLTSAKLTVDDVAPFMQFSLAIGSNYFMEIAKLRAARLLWTRMVEQYHPSNRASLQIYIHSTTALWNKSIYDPYINILRTTTEGMSAAIGNADSISILPFDVAFKDPDEISTRIARNQQFVLKEESYLDKIIDPAGGSYYIENLTHALAQHAWKLFKEVESRGGMIESIKTGFIQDEVERSRQQKERDIEQRRIVILGTNQYPNLQESMAEKVQKPDEWPIDATSPFKKLNAFRGARAFEEVRLATERYVIKGNKRPGVFLFNMGNLAMLRARAGFITNFFGCAGYDIFDNQGFSTIDEGVDAALASGAEIVVICSSDEEYGAIVPEIAQKMNNASGTTRILVAGYPKDLIEILKAAGVDDFIHLRSNLLETLRNSQGKLGIK